MSLPLLPQGSDEVVWNIIRKNHSRIRPHCTRSRARRPYFTHERNNLVQINTFKYSGYRRETVGLKQNVPLKGQGENFSLVMVGKNKFRHPRLGQKKAPIFQGSGLKVSRQIRAQTTYRLYRTDLYRAARKRVWKVLMNRRSYRHKVKLHNARNPPKTKEEKKESTEEKKDIAMID